VCKLRGGLSQNFGYHAAAVNVNAAPSTPAVTAMSIIAPHINLNIQKPNVDAVKADGNNAVGLATNAQAQLQTGAQDCKAAVSGSIDAIKKAQSEALAACSANGVGNVHPNTNTAPTSVAGMVVGTAAGLAAGKGSMGIVQSGMLHASDGAGLYEDIKKGMSGKAPEEIALAVADTLRASSSQNWTPPNTAIIKDANETPRLDKPTSIDWETALDADPDFLEKILSFDGENLECFPEVKALADLGLEIERDIGALEGVKTAATSITLGEVDMFALANTTAQAPIIDAVAFSADAPDGFEALRREEMDRIAALAANMTSRPSLPQMSA